MGFDPDRLDGRDPEVIRAVLPIAQAINARHFRLERDGLEHLPRGPTLFVSNHNGGNLGPDIPCTMAMVLEVLGVDAPLYALAHDFAMRQLPVVGRVMQKFGAVRASSDNATKILSSGGAALVYPGGDLEAYRHSRDKDRIVFGTGVSGCRRATSPAP